MYYIVSAYYRTGDKDAAIVRAAKRSSDGSGTLSTGERDLSFFFRQKPAAYAAATRISALRGVRASVTDYT